MSEAEDNMLELWNVHAVAHDVGHLPGSASLRTAAVVFSLLGRLLFADVNRHLRTVTIKDENFFASWIAIITGCLS